MNQVKQTAIAGFGSRPVVGSQAWAGALRFVIARMKHSPDMRRNCVKGCAGSGRESLRHERGAKRDDSKRLRAGLCRRTADFAQRPGPARC
jgi:hypothetical protein